MARQPQQQPESVLALALRYAPLIAVIISGLALGKSFLTDGDLKQAQLTIGVLNSKVDNLIACSNGSSFGGGGGGGAMGGGGGGGAGGPCGPGGNGGNGNFVIQQPR